MTDALNSCQLTNEELIYALNELLEAERAGARVLLETAQQNPPENLAVQINEIQRDEIRWCKMLINVIRSLDIVPSRKTGAFYEKAIAITNLKERLIFINRGQGWVVRRLSEIIPRMQDVNIRKQLEEMRDAHVDNIELVKKSLGET
jgi:nitronate monooxygenase